MAHVILVDDDRTILNTVTALLEGEGHKVTGFTDPETALRNLKRIKPDMAMVDVQMPRLDGFEMLRRIRETSNLPVMFLSGKTSDLDEAMGLRLGADDYVAKPCSPRVLAERVRNCLRRRQDTGTKADQDTTLDAGALHMDRECHLVSWMGQPVALTATEFNVLWIIAQRPNVVFSRTRVLDAAYGAEIHVTDRSIDSQIKRIRLKMRRIDPAFDAIETLYGLGYRFVLPEPAERKQAA